MACMTVLLGVAVALTKNDCGWFGLALKCYESFEIWRGLRCGSKARGLALFDLLKA